MICDGGYGMDEGCYDEDGQQGKEQWGQILFYLVYEFFGFEGCDQSYCEEYDGEDWQCWVVVLDKGCYVDFVGDGCCFWDGEGWVDGQVQQVGEDCGVLRGYL